MRSNFKNQDRVRISKETSTYHNTYGTIVETDPLGHKVSLDGVERLLRFVPQELEAAPSAPLELTRTQKYLRELEEDAKLMMDASDLLPAGSGVQKDLRDFAGRQTKIVHLLKQCLHQDSVKLWEDEDGVE